MKTKRFDFNFKPLQLDISLTTGSSVPDSQNYDADTNEWEKIIREEKEKQQADLIYELDKVNKSNIGNE